MLVGGNNGVNNQYLNVLFYPLGSVATPNPMPTCLNGAKDEIDGTEREFTALFPNAGAEKKSVLGLCRFLKIKNHESRFL